MKAEKEEDFVTEALQCLGTGLLGYGKYAADSWGQGL